MNDKFSFNEAQWMLKVFDGLQWPDKLLYHFYREDKFFKSPEGLLDRLSKKKPEELLDLYSKLQSFFEVCEFEDKAEAENLLIEDLKWFFHLIGLIENVLQCPKCTSHQTINNGGNRRKCKDCNHQFTV